MTELEMLQRKMDVLEETEDELLKENVYNCAKMLLYGGSRKAVVAFMDMAVHFYGRERIAAVIENYGFIELKEFL